METNPRTRMPEWAPPPPVAVPPPVPQQRPITPSQEKEFEDILGNLVEHYSALPPPSFGEPPVEESTATTRRGRRVPGWLFAVGGIVVALGTGAGLVLSGVVSLERLGIRTDSGPATVTAPATPAPAPVVADNVKITVHTPKAEPLPAAEPEPAVVPAAVETAAPVETATAPSPVVKPVVKKKPVVRQAKRNRAHRVSRPDRVVTRPANARRSGGDDWVDPYQ